MSVCVRVCVLCVCVCERERERERERGERVREHYIIWDSCVVGNGFRCIILCGF